MANCFYHEDREAAARCAVCGKGVCEECMIIDGEYSYCSEECKAKAASSIDRSNDVLTEKKKTGNAKLVRKLIYIFAVLLAAAAAYFYFNQNQSNADKSVKQIKNGFNNSIKEAKKLVR